MNEQDSAALMRGNDGGGSEDLFEVTLTLKANRTTMISVNQRYDPNRHLHDLRRVLEDALDWLDKTSLRGTIYQVVTEVLGGSSGPGLIGPDGRRIIVRRP